MRRHPRRRGIPPDRPGSTKRRRCCDPAGTPRPIVERLSAEANRILRDPQVVDDRLVAHGLEPKPTTPERFQEIVKDERVVYAKLAKDANIKPE